MGLDIAYCFRDESGALRVNILSIQSWVTYGHVGNASAVFPLQRLGAEVWAINTVQFSNHTGYGDWKGTVYSGESVRDLVDGIAARGALERCDAVLTGYVGGADIGDAILYAIGSVRRANPKALYCCDPVIGDDDTGVYVRPGIEAFLREHALPAADIATPNRFEIERLTGLSCATLHEAKQAVLRLRSMLHGDGAGLCAADQSGDRRDASGLYRYDDVRGQRVSCAADTSAEVERQRRGGCDRGVVSLSPAAKRQRGDSAGGGGVLGLRVIAADGGGGFAGDSDRCGAGGVRDAEPMLRRDRCVGRRWVRYGWTNPRLSAYMDMSTLPGENLICTRSSCGL